VIAAKPITVWKQTLTFAVLAEMCGRRRKKMSKQADDMPSHVFSTMTAMLDMCENVFPTIQRKDLAETFVRCYFNQAEQKEDKPS